MSLSNNRNIPYTVYTSPMAFSLEDEQPVCKKTIKARVNGMSEKKKTWILIAIVVILVFFTPWRINILLLGIDPTEDGSALGRSDTMILTSIPPILPDVHVLSIPRDLYVDIPGHGQNRINTAHYFAELEKTGSGPTAAVKTVAEDFSVARPYFVRIKVDGFKAVVKAMGGVDINLPTDMAGLTAGIHHFNAPEALTFVRSRTGSDDFFRQQRQQMFLKAAFVKMINPLNWWRVPAVTVALVKSIDTNVPMIYLPRIAYSLLFSTVRGVDMQTFDRYTMVTPWVTEGGGQVLLPNWEGITPVIEKYFK
jgi:polyisoprenyl-teichoic acid--peptidoglycan teichoic acid transferase